MPDIDIVDEVLQSIRTNFKRRCRSKLRRSKTHLKPPGKRSPLPTVWELNGKAGKYGRQAKRAPNHPLKGRRLSETHKLRISKGLNQHWIVVDPDGKEILVTNMKLWCKRRGLSYKSMSAVSCQRLKQHQGYTCRKLDNTVNTNKLMALVQSVQ